MGFLRAEKTELFVFFKVSGPLSDLINLVHDGGQARKF